MIKTLVIIAIGILIILLIAEHTINRASDTFLSIAGIAAILIVAYYFIYKQLKSKL